MASKNLEPKMPYLVVPLEEGVPLLDKITAYTEKADATAAVGELLSGSNLESVAVYEASYVTANVTKRDVVWQRKGNSV